MSSSTMWQPYPPFLTGSVKRSMSVLHISVFAKRGQPLVDQVLVTLALDPLVARRRATPTSLELSALCICVRTSAAEASKATVYANA